jgi:hypothetical protein
VHILIFTKKPLFELADYYISKKYKVPIENISIKNILSIVLATQPTTDIVELLHTKLQKELNPTLCNDLRAMMDRAIRQTAHEVRLQALDCTDLPEDLKLLVREHLTKNISTGTASMASTPDIGTTGTKNSIDSIANQVPVHTKKQKVQGTSTTINACTAHQLSIPAMVTTLAIPVPRGTGNSDGLDLMRKIYTTSKNTAGRINTLYSIDKYLQDRYMDHGTGSKTSNLTEVARVWYQRNCKKVNDCVGTCYGGDITVFIATMQSKLGSTLFQGRNYCCPECQSTKK